CCNKIHLEIQCWFVLTYVEVSHEGFEIEFLEKREGESVVLPCGVEPRNPSPIAVYLKRSWLRPVDVLFMYTQYEFTVTNDDDKNRITVSGDPSSHSLNVTISQLTADDTDRYYCEFVVANLVSEDLHVYGRTEFFLLVKAGECFFFSCHPTHTFHLYEIKSVCSFCLFTDLFSFCLDDCQGKAHHSVKLHPQAPIYEVMTGLQPLSQKLASHHLEEIEFSEYRNCTVKKSCPENHYESPSGPLCSRT
uniref:Ig-like domain-containing protein n=1 Tax=Seriola dumerili TaxID=41447 RepID=A0A3B4T482_SERDU